MYLKLGTLVTGTKGKNRVVFVIHQLTFPAKPLIALTLFLEADFLIVIFIICFLPILHWSVSWLRLVEYFPYISGQTTYEIDLSGCIPSGMINFGCLLNSCSFLIFFSCFSTFLEKLFIGLTSNFVSAFVHVVALHRHNQLLFITISWPQIGLPSVFPVVYLLNSWSTTVSASNLNQIMCVCLGWGGVGWGIF